MIDVILNICIPLLVGLCLGSLINVLIYRLPKGENWITGRSKCPICRTKLPPLSLIPVVSYLLQKGKCKSCDQSISLQYPLIELLCAAIALSIWTKLGPSLATLKLGLFLTAILPLTIIDIRTKLLPNTLTIPLAILGIIFSIIENTWMNHLQAAVIGGAIFLAIGIIGKLIYKRHALGGGDLKLIIAIGCYWGLKITILTIYLSFILGGVIGVILLLLNKKSRQDTIPFGPFITLAWIISLSVTDTLWTLLTGISPLN